MPLVTMGDEAQAYICFCSLMDRLKPNFNSDGLAMSLKVRKDFYMCTHNILYIIYCILLYFI